MSMFRRLWKLRRNGAEDSSTDGELRAALRTLDPSRRVPGYWAEFHRVALRIAAPELARRRHLARLTVSDVVFSWSRALVPAAMIAAAAAVFFVQQSGRTPLSAPLRLEEVLWEGVDLTAADPRTDIETEISFASEIY